MRIIVDELTLAKNQYNDANAEFETLAYDAVDFTDAERTTNTTEEIAQETALLNETSLKLFGKTVFELDDTEKQFLEKLLNAVTNEDGKFEEEEWGNFQDVFSDNIPKNEQSNEVPAKFSNKDEYLEYLFQNYSSLSEEDRAIADKHLEEEKIKEESCQRSACL